MLKGRDKAVVAMHGTQTNRLVCTGDRSSSIHKHGELLRCLARVRTDNRRVCLTVDWTEKSIAPSGGLCPSRSRVDRLPVPTHRHRQLGQG